MTQQNVNQLASEGKSEAELIAAGATPDQIAIAKAGGHLTNVPANAGLTIGQIYNINVTGFTFIQDYSVIKGKITENDEAVSVIIGDKMSFGISEMFKLKEASGIEAKYTKDTVVKGVTYKRFQLEQICW
jgi:hypothetical protein